MDGLMPSEIARLVLGYLMETKCMKTTGMFLNESPHLNEYVECLLKGKEYPATINGKTLLDILNEYATLKSKVGCGEAEVQMSGVSCQTSPQAQTQTQQSVEVERLPTPAPKCPSLMPTSSFTFSTPTCRPVDLFSSPSVLVKSVLFGFQDSNSCTPSKSDQAENTSIECRSNSPRRKGPLPRKRLYSPSANALTPSSASKRRQIEERDATSSTSTPSSAAEDAVSTSGCVGDAVDVTALIDGMLHNSVLHERIAANINHEKAHPTVSIAEIPDETMPDMIIKNIVDRTESDPVFEAFLNVFLDKHDGSSRDSQSSQVSAVEADRGEGKAAEASPAEGSAQTAVSNCSAVSGAGDVAYLVPVEPNNGSGSVFQLVLGASAEVPNSAVQFFQVNHSHPKASSPPKLDTRTISPGQLFTLCGAPAQAKKQQQVEKQDNQGLIKRAISKTDDKLKKSFIRRTCAVKSLDFGQDAGGCVRPPQLVSRTLKPTTAGIPKPRAESAGCRSTMTTTTTVRPRLNSLLRSAEILEVAKSSDDVAAQTQKSTEGSPKAKTKEVSKKLARGKGHKEPKSQSDGSQKTQDKLEADKVTEGGFSTNSQPDLSKMNVDEFLSGIQYVD